MNIAINTRFLLPGVLEGFGWYTHEIVSRMVKNHPEDHFFFFFDRSFDRRFIYAKNVTPMVLFPQARLPFLFRWWFEYSVPRALKKIGADVFFSPDSMCSLRSHVPVVMTCHDLVPLHFPEQIEKRHRSYLLKYLPKWLDRANHVLTVSRFVEQDLKDSCHVPPEKLTAVYNGCREIFQPLAEAEQALVRDQFSDGRPYFFFAGAIHPRKNVHRIIDAYDRFRAEGGDGVKLLLAGRFAWQTGIIKSAWEQAKFRDDITFLGYLDEAELPKLTASALAMLYPSMGEGFGLPLVEAMASDVPVITSNISCLPEVAGDAALLVDPMDPADIARAMMRIWQEPELRQQLIEKGRVRKTAFNWSEAAEKIYDILVKTARQAAR